MLYKVLRQISEILNAKFITPTDTFHRAKNVILITLINIYIEAKFQIMRCWYHIHFLYNLHFLGVSLAHFIDITFPVVFVF